MSQFNLQPGNNQAFLALQQKAMERKGRELSGFQQDAQRFGAQGMSIARDLISQSYQGELGPTAGLAAEGLSGEFARFTPGTDVFARHQQLQAERRTKNRQRNRELGKIEAEIAGLGQSRANRQQGFQRVLQRYAGEMSNSESTNSLIQGLADAINKRQDRLAFLSGGGVLGLGEMGSGEAGTVVGGFSERIRDVMAQTGDSRYQAAKRIMQVPGETMEKNVRKANILGAVGDFFQDIGEGLGLGGGTATVGAGTTVALLGGGPVTIGIGAVIAGLGALGLTEGFDLLGDDTLDEVNASVNKSLETFRPNVDAALQANLLVVSEEIGKISGGGAGKAEAVFDGMNQLIDALGKSTNPNDEEVIQILDNVARLKKTHNVSLEQLYHGLRAAEQASSSRQSSMSRLAQNLETQLGVDGGVVNTEENRLALKVFRQGAEAESDMARTLASARMLLEDAGDKVTDPELRFHEASERAQAAEDILDGTLDGLVMPDGSITPEAEELFAVIDPNVAGKLRDFLEKKAQEETQLASLEEEQVRLGELLDPMLSPEIAEQEVELANLLQENTERNIEIQRERDTEGAIVSSLLSQISSNLEGLR